MTTSVIARVPSARSNPTARQPSCRVAARAVFAFLLVLVTSAVTASAQQPTDQQDSARAQIHTRLRAFYFNLAHQGWEALTADILAAKVVAHRPAPEALVKAAESRRRSARFSSAAGQPLRCSSTAGALVNRATVLIDGDWAEVSVPRCGATGAGADEFRLIHFEARWRFVYVDLFEDPVNVSTHR